MRRLCGDSFPRSHCCSCDPARPSESSLNFHSFVVIDLTILVPAGEQNGYNIPEVVSFSDLRWWLSEEGTVFLLTTRDDKVLPEMARRLLCDAYMCFYQSTEIMMYR